MNAPARKLLRAWPGLGAALLSALLLGCASAPKPRAYEGEHLSGRISVQVANNSGGSAQGGAAAFDLQGNPETGQLELSTPLGSLAARASWKPGEALLQRYDTETRYPDLDALTRDLLGEAVPVVALFDWLRGRPWTGASSHALPAPKQGFKQLGWTVDLSRFAEGLVLAQRQEPSEVSLRARLDPTDKP